MTRGIRRWSAAVRITQAMLRNMYAGKNLVGKSRKQNIVGTVPWSCGGSAWSRIPVGLWSKVAGPYKLPCNYLRDDPFGG